MESLEEAVCGILRRLTGAICGITDLLQEQFVESMIADRSSLWNIRPLTGAVCQS